ncbi:MAG TPA: hypothetical protein VFF06_01005 [Polyangia bacterium]|nr:hypothetical protein [Polyangia bacterium]
MGRLRFDLDGIPLDDEDGRTTAILRFRTTRGLVLALPESVDVTLAWADLARATVDLAKGRIQLEVADGARARHPWLGGARVLEGVWTDRELLREPPAR